METKKGSLVGLYSGGFTLIELMITLAVIAVLTSIAYPSYREQIAKGSRAEGRGVLMQAAQWMERHFSENNRYDQNTAGTAVATLMPDNLKRAPSDGSGVRYTLTVTATQTAYTLTMARAGTQSGDPCGDYRVNALGVRTLANYSTDKYSTMQAAIQRCWR